MGAAAYEERCAALRAAGRPGEGLAPLLEGRAGEGFAVTRLGEPPAALLLLLSLLLAPAPPRPEKQGGDDGKAKARAAKGKGGSEPTPQRPPAAASAAALIKAFAALPRSEQLARARVGAGGEGAQIVAAALRAQVTRYPQPAEALAAPPPALEADSWAARMQALADVAGAARRERAAQLVRGQKAIWAAAEAWLAQAAPGAAVGGKAGRRAGDTGGAGEAERRGAKKRRR